MGYQGVTIAKRLLNNEEVASKVFTDLVLVTGENIDFLEIQEVIAIPAANNSK